MSKKIGAAASNVALNYAEGYWRLTDNSQGKINWETENGVPSPSAPGKPSHAMVFDDVSGLSIDGFRAKASPDGEPILRLVNVKDATLRGCTTLPADGPLLSVGGSESAGIHVWGSTGARDGKTVVREKGAEPAAVEVHD